jgi:exodeoxyribonuclease-3
VALYARRRRRVLRGFGVDRFDREVPPPGAGRKLSVVSLYLPSGSAGPAPGSGPLCRPSRRICKSRRAAAHFILSGDWNIAHKPIDLRNWRSNQKNSGFLPEERAWMDQLFGPAGYVDAFREVRPQADLYTWWSNRGQARANNVGWRIDYQVVSGTLAGKARAASIYKERRFSDHAPLTMDYDL